MLRDAGQDQHAVVQSVTPSQLRVRVPLEAVLALREHSKVPVVLVDSASSQSATGADAAGVKKFRVDGAHSSLPRLHYLTLGATRVGVAPQHAADGTTCGDAMYSTPIDISP